MLKVKSVFIISCVILPIVRATCPNIISRTEWNARPPRFRSPLRVNPPPYVVIHHSAGPNCYTESSCKTVVKGIQNYHMDTQQWPDIGYNFLIGGDGNVYEGRGWGIHGAHAPKYNGKSLGICLLGNFSDRAPSELQLNTLKKLIQCASEKNKVKAKYKVIGHRQAFPTECPGNDLFAIIKKWSHFEPNPS